MKSYSFILLSGMFMYFLLKKFSCLKFLCLYILIFLPGCTDEYLIKEASVVDGSKVKMQIYIGVSNQQIMPISKSLNLNDSYINPASLNILVFNENEELVELNHAEAIGSGESVQYYTNLTSTTQQRKVYIIANASNIFEDKKNGWIVNRTTLSEIKKELLKTSLPVSNGVVTMMPYPHPMVGYVNLSGISSTTSLGTADSKIELTRATVKIKITNGIQQDNMDIQLLGANLMNVPLQGYVFSLPEDEQVVIARGNYGNSDTGVEGMLGSFSAEKAANLYCYESYVTDNHTSVIIKASYKNTIGYYRINFIDAEKKQLDLKRNFEYQVNITQINSFGYPTAAEAINNPASNEILYDLTVKDPNSHDIVSNGQYYLGVSNSELIVYSGEDLFNLPVTVVTHNAPASVLSRTVKVEYGNVSVINPSVLSTSGLGGGEELKINLPKSVLSAGIKLNLGNLTKTITIIRRPAIPEPGGVITDFGSSEYVTGNVETGENSWLKLSAISYSTDGSLDNLVNPNGGIYIHAMSNVGFENEVHDRQGIVFIARPNESGRIKVILKQNKLDIYRDKIQIEPFTYVGTFHRWYQTGERVIRIKPKVAGPNSLWTAVVVEGKEWIELSAAKSPDPGLGDDPYGVGDHSNWSDNDIESKAQLNSDSLTIKGVGEKIYFRVGLKSQLPGGSLGKPRYGLVAVVHDKGNHFIFVRQGEQSDFLMREFDPVTQDPSGFRNPQFEKREYAVPVSPYNLTDPDGQGGKVDLGKNGYDFVKYPSQAGYYFYGASTIAYRPNAISSDRVTDSNNSFSELWNTDKETCPPGYRRFHDGPNDRFNPYVEGNALNPGPQAVSSEVRQSLWLYPRNGGLDQVNFQNVVRGFIADGFFDRQEMRTPSGNFPSSNSSVGDGAELAFSGALFFNPHNYASVFFPEAGLFSDGSTGGTAGTFAWKGQSGVYWTDSSFGANAGWSVQTGFGSSSNPLVADNYRLNVGVGASIRCVKDK